MPIPQLGNVVFPFVLGETESNLFVRNVTQTFLTDETKLEEINRLAANRVFFFGALAPEGQEAEDNYIQLVVANAVFEDASDNLAGYNQTLDILQYIGFSGERTILDLYNAVFSTLDGSQQRVLIEEQEDCSNAFGFLDHDTVGIFPRALTRSFNATDVFLSQTVFGGSEEDVTNFFDFSSVTDSSDTDYDRDETQLAIKDHVTFTIQGASCPEKEYTPYVGSSGDDSYDEISLSPPVLGDGTLTLTHPRVAPTTTLVLKNPEYGNQDTIQYTRIDRNTRGGDRKLFSDPKWGKTQTFQLTISNIDDLCYVSLDSILDFLNTSLGEEIGLLDWEGRTWKGIILTPETDVIPQVSGTRVVITFEGELV